MYYIESCHCWCYFVDRRCLLHHSSIRLGTSNTASGKAYHMLDVVELCSLLQLHVEIWNVYTKYTKRLTPLYFQANNEIYKAGVLYDCLYPARAAHPHPSLAS